MLLIYSVILVTNVYQIHYKFVKEIKKYKNEYDRFRKIKNHR